MYPPNAHSLNVRVRVMVGPKRHKRKPNGRMGISIFIHLDMLYPFESYFNNRQTRIQNGIWLELYVGSKPSQVRAQRTVWHPTHPWNKARNRRGAPIDQAAP